MTNDERIRRIQRWVNVVDDGDIGDKTLKAIEQRLGIVEFAGTKLPPTQPEKPSVGAEFDLRTERMLATLLPVAAISMRTLLRIAAGQLLGKGLEVRAISGTRTWAEQDELYKIGRRGRKGEAIVTRAMGGDSHHNYGIALDLGVFRGKTYLDEAEPSTASRVYAELADVVRRRNMPVDWGGDWKSFRDEPHWEFRTGLTLAQMRARVSAGKAIV